MFDNNIQGESSLRTKVLIVGKIFSNQKRMYFAIKVVSSAHFYVYFLF